MDNTCNQRASTTIDRILARTNGALLVPLHVFAELVGLKPATVRNQKHYGRFPLPTIRIGGITGVRVDDLAALLDGTWTKPEESARRGPGRPRRLGGCV